MFSSFDEFLVFFGFRTQPSGVEKVQSVLSEFNSLKDDLAEGLDDISVEVSNREDAIERRREAFERYEAQQEESIRFLEQTEDEALALLEGLRQLTRGVTV